VTIILHLGVQPTQQKTKAHPNVPTQSLTSFPAVSKLVTEAGLTRQQAPQKGKVCSKHPCYAFSIHGCSSAVYNVIEHNQEAIYAKLLASRNFLAEHPR
jgi:tartrate dehydratase beta subunit/fumarate hydratase class I family protein